MTSTDPIVLNGPQALRVLARAFHQFDNFERFVGALESALPRLADDTPLRLALDRSLVETAERFERHVLSLPLTTERGALGALQVGHAEQRRLFSAEDLHLLAGLADFLGAALAQSVRLQDLTRGRELLRLLLNQAPVGIAAYGRDRRPIVANELAVRWLAGAPLPFEELEAGGESFYLRSDGKLIFGEVREVGEVPGGAWMIVMHDLTSEQARLLDGVQRELYRSLAEHTPCSVVLLEVADARHGALRNLAALRGGLKSSELAGPYDATRVGLVLNATGLELRARLRRLRPLLGATAGVRLGYGELGRDGRNPEDLLKAALQRYGAFDGMLQPALLIHGENPAVAASLALVLGKDFRVVQSESEARTRQLLEAQPFEGIVAELDPSREGEGHGPIVHHARTVQPGIRTLYTTVQPRHQVRVEPDALVIEKPFNVSDLAARVRRQVLGS